MLRVTEHWHASDLGRQRQGNEDAFFVRSPLFAVADGMGGAQAGEVASEIAVGALQRGIPGEDAAAGLVRVIEDANRRIHEHALADADRAGMGTTMTAAYVGADEVTIAHVGDSRAYLMRGGDLIRLTRDHSLVEELIARGKLTEEERESHPQRSVITRALGPEPQVEVDVDVFPARPGDVFLICSDGLTGMIPEPRIKEILGEADTLERAGRALIASANEAGGRDNITVVMFRLGDADAADAADQRARAVTSEQPAAPAREDDGPATAVHTTADPSALAVADPAHGVPPREPIDEAAAGRRAAGPPGRRRRRLVPGWTIFALIVLAIVGSGFWTASRVVYFVGTDASRAGEVTVYRGLPYELPFGVKLYERYAGSGVTLQQVPADRRGTFTNHKLRARDDAENLVIALGQGKIE
jgi:protein phosphatase